MPEVADQVTDEGPLLRLPALRLRQGAGREVFAFGVEGKQLPEFTDIDRIRRDDDGLIHGYQRTEILTHTRAIRDYLTEPDALLPNAIVVAFARGRARFEPAPDAVDVASACTTVGTLIVSLAGGDGDDKAALVVDGQQRRAALREAQISSFPVYVTAYVPRDPADEREQFVRVNSARPLPKSLIYELLPTTAGPLPPALARLQFPAVLAARLNQDPDSPLAGRIKTPTNPDGIVRDNSILRHLEASLSDGALYRHRDPHTGRGDIEAMLELLKAFWAAVARVFPDAWALPLRRSRLHHGAGVTALGFVMDTIAAGYPDTPTVEDFTAALAPLTSVCAWTAGTWVFRSGSTRQWNEIQNTSSDISLLTQHLTFHLSTAATSKGTAS
jgi:DGQHR domain-containing protein